MRDPRGDALSERLRDARSGEVVFLSHCLLDPSTRYLGGAFHRGAVPELTTELLQRGIGIVQLPCPEQRAWGGVHKRWLLRAYGARGTRAYRLRRPLLRLFEWHTRLVYRRLARQVAAEVRDYVDAGLRVRGIVGVGGSPSCGVHATMSLQRALEVVAAPIDELERGALNRRLLVECRRRGRGLFVRELQRALTRRGVDVPLLEHDLLAELRGEPQDVLGLGGA